MKIVVLDGYAANPGDLNWDELRTLGECEIYDRTAPDEVLERSKDAEAILTNKVVITAEHMASLPNLKYIGVIATGYNIIDVAAAKERGITVTNIPAYSTPSVGQMVFAHILNITQRVDSESGFLLLGYSAYRAVGKEDRSYRPGTNRIQHSPYRYRIWYESVGLYI